MPEMPTILMPVTRDWALHAVVAAISASDLPRGRFRLVHDATDASDEWESALGGLGFTVESYFTGFEDPIPTERVARRPRHSKMRAFTLSLVPDGPLFILDDDSIVPSDVYARLSTAGEHATGVQVSRHNPSVCGVYRNGLALTRGSGVEPIDYCGHFCLLTTGAMYRATATHAADQYYMQPIPGLVCDWDCVVGHLTEDGILWPDGRAR